jgi:hypothetical protein
MNWKGYRRNQLYLNHGTVLALACRGWRNSRKTSVRIACVPTEIRTEKLQNTSRHFYRYIIRNWILILLFRICLSARDLKQLHRPYWAVDVPTRDECRWINHEENKRLFIPNKFFFWSPDVLRANTCVLFAYSKSRKYSASNGMHLTYC